MKMGKKLIPKMKMKMKKFGKMNSIFELSISELGYMAIFIKICGKKNFDPLFRTFLTNQDKNENEDEKYGKMSPIFEFSISKLDYVAIFMKICRKNFFDQFFKTFLTNRGKNEDED